MLSSVFSRHYRDAFFLHYLPCLTTPFHMPGIAIFIFFLPPLYYCWKKHADIDILLFLFAFLFLFSRHYIDIDMPFPFHAEVATPPIFSFSFSYEHYFSFFDVFMSFSYILHHSSSSPSQISFFDDIERFFIFLFIIFTPFFFLPPHFRHYFSRFIEMFAFSLLHYSRSLIMMVFFFLPSSPLKDYYRWWWYHSTTTLLLHLFSFIILLCLFFFAIYPAATLKRFPSSHYSPLIDDIADIFITLSRLHHIDAFSCLWCPMPIDDILFVIFTCHRLPDEFSFERLLAWAFLFIYTQKFSFILAAFFFLQHTTRLSLY